jgi:hypothetical protein
VGTPIDIAGLRSRLSGRASSLAVLRVSVIATDFVALPLPNDIGVGIKMDYVFRTAGVQG